MRVGKRVNVVEAKKTRSCVVRLEKVGPSPPKKPTRGNAATLKSQPKEEKKLRGPIKKRPITESPTPSQSSPSTATPKANIKSKMSQKVSKQVTREAVYETSPTIAAGRSRRAIKPNPKYACEDMVTPKMMKNVGALGQSSSTASHKKSAVGDKERQRSTSSSEDFFNKESSDDLADDIDMDEVVDKAYQIDEKLNTDSDFSDLEVSAPVVPKKRGRPRKDERTAAVGARPLAGAPLTVYKSATPPKSTLSHLQQLRKTLSSSASRVTVVSTSIKRKLNTESAASAALEVTTKRMRLVPMSRQVEPTEQSVNHKNLSEKSGSASQSLNGNKITTILQSSKVEPSEKRKMLLDKRVLNLKASPKVSPTRTQHSVVLNKTVNEVKQQPTAKQRSASPATTKPISTKDAPESSEEKKKETAPPPSNSEDIESMPTFTIVNINDIINKKGDVLISKSGQRPVAVAKLQKTEDRTKTDNTAASSNSSITETKLNKRKAVHSIILSEKVDSTSVKNTLPRALSLKKGTSTLLNKTSTSVTAPKCSSLSTGKPAPRILNSVVAKKTQPVKPMIANLDDSADESFPLSLDGDEDDEDEDDEEDQEDDIDADESETFLGNHKLNSSLSPYLSTKKTLPATKENSLAATNRIPEKATTRKLSPEKVVISRQGDKIIKKITCFETWYVINTPQVVPLAASRNTLEIPLIKLANAANDIELPSDSWSSKVTLYELSATTLAKSTPITYTGDLTEHNISEEDRGKYQPLCVMFRRAVSDRLQSRLPYDRAVIFKNKTFFTNIEGKNVKLECAPTVIATQTEVEILLQIVDGLTLQSHLVEPATTVQ